MADSYYPDSASPSGGAPEEQDDPSTSSGQAAGDESKMAGQTALIPKALLGGKEFKPGEEVVMKIVHDHGDEVEVAYATGHDEGNKNSDGDSPEMAGAMGRMSSMGADGY